MKKLIKLSSILVVLLICGCGKEKYITCTNNIDNTQGNYKLNATYKIYYNKSYVTKIEKDEKYTSNDKSVLDYFEESNDLTYSNSNDLYGGFTYNIKRNKEYVSINTVIDFNIADIKKMVREGYLDKNYVVSNRFTTSGAKKYYEAIGATCEE